MAEGLQAPCFRLIADATLTRLRREAAAHAFVEPFMRDLPKVVGLGVHDHVAQLQRELVLMAEGERLLRLMAEHEMEIRIVFGLGTGTRKIDASPAAAVS